MIGEIINDKYRVEAAFSESRIYEVFTATELETGAIVVVKLMKPSVLANNAMVTVFTSEVKSFAKLSHPFVAEILDIDMFGERPYIVTPLVEGRELNLVAQERVMEFADCQRVVRDLGTILQYAAEAGVDCRTIKLSNVLVEENKKLKLLSFTQPRLRTVTSSARSESVGVHSDLYFLGITLYELLAGESPIRARGGLNELWDMKLERAMRVRHGELAPKQIATVIEFINKTITRDTNIRFESHEEFLLALATLSGQVRVRVARKQDDRQLSIAAQVVDALNGASNLIAMAPSQSEATAKQQPAKKVAAQGTHKPLAARGIKKPSPMLAGKGAETPTDHELGKAELSDGLAIDGNLALVADNSAMFVNEESNPFAHQMQKMPKPSSPKQRPNLKIVKSEVAQARETRDSEWEESSFSLKNPVVYLGLLLTIMVALILFW